MAREETCILTNMCMVCNGERVLVIDREEPDWPGITFPGGHVESGESFVESVIREIKEETGLVIGRVQLCGVKQWSPPDKAFRYVVFLFKTDCFAGELHSSREGQVFWVDRQSLHTYSLAEGFETALDVFLHEDMSESIQEFCDGEWHGRNL